MSIGINVERYWYLNVHVLFVIHGTDSSNLHFTIVILKHVQHYPSAGAVVIV